MNANQLCFGWALRHNLLFLGVAESHTLAKAHHCTRVGIAIVVDGISSVNPPTWQHKAIHQQFQWHIYCIFEVTKQLLYLCPILFLGGFNSCREKCHHWLEVTSALALKNNNWAAAWWNACSYSSSRGLASIGLLTVNRWSAARDVRMAVISFKKLEMMFLIYSIILIATFPFSVKSKIIPRKLYNNLPWWVATNIL